MPDFTIFLQGGAERQRQGTGKPFYLNLWENLDKTQSERFEHWKRKVQKISCFISLQQWI